MAKILILFLTGAVLGPICDGFHSHSNTLTYPDPWIFQMAWWVPPLFGLAVLAIARSHADCDRRFGFTVPRPSWTRVITGLVVFIALYFVSGFLVLGLFFKSLIVLTGSLVIWHFFDRRRYALLLAIATAIVGCLVEITLTALDLFYYTDPDFLGIPLWLPFLYIGASVSVGNLGRKLYFFK